MHNVDHYILLPCSMDLPAEHILDHYRHPRNMVVLERFSIMHEEKNWSCGDALSVQLYIEHDRITAIGWSGEGCAISQAAMSLLTQSLQGKRLAEADALTVRDIFEMLAIPVGARRLKCALLGLHTLKNAMRMHANLPLLTWAETVGEL